MADQSLAQAGALKMAVALVGAGSLPRCHAAPPCQQRNDSWEELSK
jgi:hypothetical protein